MATLGAMALDSGDGSFPTAIAFWLRTKSSFDIQDTSTDDWEVLLATRHDIAVARCKKAMSRCDALAHGRSAIETTLDNVCFRLNEPLELKPDPRDSVSLTREHDERVLTYWTTVPFPVRVGPIEVRVIDKDGKEKPAERTRPKWMPLLRYYRLSQAREDIFDAYRYMFLVFEAALQTLWPIQAGREREVDWLERAVGELAKRIDLTSYAPAGATDLVKAFVSSQYSHTGHIRARTEENLAFRIDGRMITRLVDVGQRVQPGDPIAQLDPQPQRDALRAAQAKLAAAEAAQHEAANNLERKQTLVQDGWATRVQFDAAQRAFLSAKAESDAAAAQVHQAEDQLGYTNLVADASGAVIAAGSEAGEVVRAGQMIVTVAHDDGNDAVFDVPASLMRQVSPDAIISISLTDDPSVHTEGQVREVAPQADPVTRSYRVKVGLTARPDAMRLGATVSGQTRMLSGSGVDLPATALTMADNKPALWVVDPASHQVSLRRVELERQDSSRIVVTRGIDGGELVVAAGVHSLRPGQKVRLTGDQP